jgi:type I restriction-modification system DNA methylase subunit
MLLHGIEVPVQIRHDNTLNKPLSSWDEQLDVIVTNPPFGGTEEDGIEKNFPAEMQTRETADLFLQLIVEVLAKNGRAAVVLPDGTLFGEGVKTKIKKLLTEECNLHTIVRLPNGVFNPYTGIKTNLLFFTKGQPTKDIWFYEHPYPAGVKNYSKTKPMKFEEFQAEIDWWGNEADGFASRVENEQAWKVSIDEVIARNFNLDIKTRTRRKPSATIRTNCWRSTRSSRKKSRPCATSCAISSARRSPVRRPTDGGGKTDCRPYRYLDHGAANPLHGGRGSSGKIDLYGIKKLRELILELAVRGKLVPQDPNDEPASELLKRIAAEKAELVKQGKIKKPKPLPEISEEEKPFELPEGWEWVRVI